MSSAKIRGETSAEAGVQRISPPTICQKSFLSVTAEKLRVNSLLIEKNIGFVKSQMLGHSLPAPNPIPARLVCLHFSRLSPGIAVQRSEKQINIGWKVSVRSRASKCPTQLTVDGGSVDLIV